MSHIMRKPVYDMCGQQRRRSPCAFAHSDQHLCCSLLRYSAGEEKSPLFIFLHDQLPFFLGGTGRNSGKGVGSRMPIIGPVHWQ